MKRRRLPKLGPYRPKWSDLWNGSYVAKRPDGALVQDHVGSGAVEYLALLLERGSRRSANDSTDVEIYPRS